MHSGTRFEHDHFEDDSPSEEIVGFQKSHVLAHGKVLSAVLVYNSPHTVVEYKNGWS